MSWVKLDAIAVANNAIIIQLAIPWQLAEMNLVIHMQLRKCACTSNSVTHHNFILAAWTGITKQDWCWQFRPMWRNSWTQGLFLLACAEVMPLVTFCCVTMETMLALSCEVTMKEILLCKKAQHFEVVSQYSRFDGPIVYTVSIPNWCFWETPPTRDPENFWYAQQDFSQVQ